MTRMSSSLAVVIDGDLKTDVYGSAGGNQREQDRAKAQKKAAANKAKPKESASSLAKRKEAYVPNALD